MYGNVPDFNVISNITYNSKNVNKEILIDLIPDYEIEEWMMDEFLSELSSKNFIKIDKKGNISITEKGKEFKRDGGYAGIDKGKKENSERQKKKDSILNFDYKWKRPLAILGVIIGVFGIIELKSCNDNNTELNLQEKTKQDTLQYNNKQKDSSKKNISKETEELKIDSTLIEKTD